MDKEKEKLRASLFSLLCAKFYENDIEKYRK
jgi:hypothetical protein